MKRDESLQALAERQQWDVLVIGGGASGLGAAVDSAARGYRTVLLEQHDFAKATSSRSTKLIHGGVRYLKQGNLSLVLESLRERGRLLRNAPHLVHPLSFIVPAHSAWEKIYYGIGLKLYDRLSGDWSLGHSQIISREQTFQHLPTIAREKFCGGVLYFDGQFDDARLAIVLAQTLADLGGAPLNYAHVSRLLKTNGHISGVVAQDLENGREFEVAARVVINATGVFTDEVRRLDDATAPPLITASRGAHIVVDRSFLPGKSALMVPKTTDGRVLFAIPWHEHVVIGTTDSATNDLSLEPRATTDEIEFLIGNASRYLERAPTKRDIRSTFAGLRPLVKSSARSTAKLSRDHTIVISPSGLVTLTGGKWTTYRKMGEDAIDHALKPGGLETRPAATATMKLHDDSDSAELEQWVTTEPALGAPLHSRLSYRGVEVRRAVRREMARTVEDVLARRTRALFLDAQAAIEMAPQVAAMMRTELGRGGNWECEQVVAFTKLARGYLVG
jgi:glycerol-3-phosphate dehydrogenase